MEINLAGYIPVSTLDDPGYSSSVIFFRGCNLDCWFCHNKKYCVGESTIDIKYVEEFLLRDKTLTSSITLSGGEPVLQYDACIRLCNAAHTMGKQVCLYTSGNQPAELSKVAPYIERAFIDFKSQHCFSGDYIDYIMNFAESLSILENNNVRIILTYVITNAKLSTIFKDINYLKSICNGRKIILIQGEENNVPFISREIMKKAFKGYYIRTREGGVEWNGKEV